MDGAAAPGLILGYSPSIVQVMQFRDALDKAGFRRYTTSVLPSFKGTIEIRTG